LEARIEGSGSPVTVRALNDVIVEKVAVGRSIRLSIAIGGEPFVGWAADGVIVATSTGSTAYSFSAGGPVVSPRLDCMIVTPVAPHGLFNRSVVVPPDEEVLVRVGSDQQAALSPDGGAAIPVEPGTEVRVRPSESRIRLAKVEPAPFWRLVRAKLPLGPVER
jgi:NAD+ kinase